MTVKKKNPTTDKPGENTRRPPRLKSKRQIISDNFHISRTDHPLRRILEEAEVKPDGAPPLSSHISAHRESERMAAEKQGSSSELVASHQSTVASFLATDTNKAARKLATHQESVASHRLKSGDRHTKPQLNIRIDADLLHEIRVFCTSNKIKIEEFMSFAASHTLHTNAASFLAHDDKKKIIFKTHEDIIMRYERYSGKKWTNRDDKDGRRFNSTDIRLIEIAFISTIDKKLSGSTANFRVGSFNYFVGEIETLLDQQKSGQFPGGLEVYHQYVLATWEKRIRKNRDEKWGFKK
ncbi:MAG: hypothetical protein K1Y36_30275 [Blastocatellia bacterium]|nr:hypothetical protein [Blastocatellia bacterium]